MTPDYEIKESVDEMLWQVVALAVLDAVLVQGQQVEPFLRVLRWPQHLDLALAEQPKEPLVFDGAQPVQSQLCFTLAEQERRDCNL